MLKKRFSIYIDKIRKLWALNINVTVRGKGQTTMEGGLK